MDLSIYLNMMISAAWYLIPIFIFAIVIKSAWFKGVLGEWQVNLLIKFFLDKNEYHLIKNVTLPTDDGTTQIDHIIVSKYGIFVVETKNMKGWIFGSENQKQWTQQIYKHKSKFQNPLHQNYKHVKTLEATLDIESNAKNDSIFSVIIFIGDSTFKTKMPENVRFARGGIEYIKSKTDIVFNRQEIANVIEQVESGRLERSNKMNRQHVKHVKKIIEEKPETKSCSKCGAEMVLRKATKGKNVGNDFCDALVLLIGFIALNHRLITLNAIPRYMHNYIIAPLKCIRTAYHYHLTLLPYIMHLPLKNIRFANDKYDHFLRFTLAIDCSLG